MRPIFYLIAPAVVVLCVLPAQANSFIVGGFNAARGGFESLASGEDEALATDISSAYAGTTFHFTDTLTTSFLSGVNVVILGVATTDSSAITPLSTDEQSALKNFVMGGGTALIFSDNSTFDRDAPAANASLLTPFGVTAAGTIGGGPTVPILNPTGPLTGPFTPVTQFATNFPGYYTNTGGGTVLAEFSPTEAAIDYFHAGFFGAGSGAVILFSDSDAMVAGDALTTTNKNLVLNAFSFTNTTVAPEPSTMALFVLALSGLVAVQLRKIMNSEHR
jgi:hypothetical protein